MRKTRIALIILSLFAAVITVTGCSSVMALFKSNISGLPFWYYEPSYNIGKDNTGMVGEGAASTERQAELLSYTNLMEILSDRIGYDLGQEVYRELSVMGTINQFGLQVVDTFSAVSSDGNYHYYIHAVLDRALLENATSEENKRRTSLSEEVESLVLEGDTFVKTGKELKAVENYMKAMALGYGVDYIDSEYSYDSLYPVVVELLQSITVSVSSSRPGDAVCTIEVQRKGTFVSSAVGSAEIKATYLAEDSKGEVYKDNFVYISDDDGRFTFNAINNSILRNGTVTFSLNLGEELDALLKVAPEERTIELGNLIESKTLTFSYAKVYRRGSIAVSVVEHDSLGYVTGVKEISDYLTSKFVSDGADASAFYSELDDEQDIIYEFNHSSRTEECMLVIRLGVVDVIESKTGLHIASAEGLVTLFNCADEVVLYQSDVINASAFAQTEEEAVTEAFKTLSDIAYTLVKAEYV